MKAALKFYTMKGVGVWSGQVGSASLPLFALMLLWASSTEAATLNQLKRSPALKAKEATYVTDPTGKRIRIVGPRFYPNPTKGLTFPGRGAKLPDRPKR
ncbi:hypothetical protein [Neorhizobium sp. LjRoot104]|uniref:hypothetical protein n=1 Tax=Neorhizobium sp. LjRoot104 TaxID=3342254 RepID=UPI003ECD51C6